MEEIIAFLKAFIEAENKFLLSLYGEINNNKYDAATANLYKFYAKGLSPGAGRPDPLPVSWKKTGTEKIKTIIKRSLFQVKEIEHEKFEVLFAAYLSLPSLYAKEDYFSIFYVSKVNDTLKLISKYDIVPESKKLQWEWTQGYQFDSFGGVKSVKKIMSPNKTRDLTDY